MCRYPYFFICEVNKLENIIIIDNRVNEVKIINQKQVLRYVSNGLQPLRLEAGYNDKLVYVFDKEASEPYFEKWRKHELM